MPEILQPVILINPKGASPVVLVCEHASNVIPAGYDQLGLAQDVLRAHVAWDPGAMGVAREMAAQLDAKLVASTVSRLVYDCNRPPSAPDAMPMKSEVYDIPGNMDLTEDAKTARIAQVYEPFREKLAETVAATDHPILVTIHSFTPIYNGKTRSLDVGILHDTDTRLADGMLQSPPSGLRVERNEPYGPQDGVTHTLQEHAVGAGHLNVMIEIRNDLIATTEQQGRFGAVLSDWLTATLELISLQEGIPCNV